MRTIIFTFAILLFNIHGMAQNTRSAEDASGLSVGVKAPDFQAIDADNVNFKLAAALKKGPVVMIFYRGYWCPICNKHLGTVQDSLKLITDRGATVVAVSPQKPEYLEKMAHKTGATFRLLYDEGYTIADAYDVTFTPEGRQLFVYNTALNTRLKKTQSDDSQRLPIQSFEFEKVSKLQLPVNTMLINLGANCFTGAASFKSSKTVVVNGEET